MPNAPSIQEVFAERLREHRQARKWSQATMARRVSELGLSMNRETIANIETRGRRVTVEEHVAIAGALDVPPLELLRPVGHVDVALAPKLELRGEFALAWMSGRVPLRRRGAQGFREAADAIRKTADTFELRIHPRARGRLRADETEMIRAYVESKRQDLAELEHVAGRNESLAKLMRDEIENARDTVTKLEKLLPKEEQ